MRARKLLYGLFAILIILPGTSLPAEDKTLIDYFLPTAIQEKLSTGVRCAAAVGPHDRGNGLEDSGMKQWNYWDGKILSEMNSQASPRLTILRSPARTPIT
jgi:hypothetical protein